MIAPGLGLVYSGIGPDARVLVSKARKSAQSYWQIHKEWPTALQIVKDLAGIMQEYTQSGYLIYLVKFFIFYLLFFVAEVFVPLACHCW